MRKTISWLDCCCCFLALFPLLLWPRRGRAYYSLPLSSQRGSFWAFSLFKAVRGAYRNSSRHLLYCTQLADDDYTTTTTQLCFGSSGCQLNVMLFFFFLLFFFLYFFPQKNYIGGAVTWYLLAFKVIGVCVDEWDSKPLQPKNCKHTPRYTSPSLTLINSCFCFLFFFFFFQLIGWGNSNGNRWQKLFWWCDSTSCVYIYIAALIMKYLFTEKYTVYLFYLPR